MRISDVIAGKASQEIITISSEASVRELLALLAEHNIGAAIVSADGTAVEGIVSERDVVRRLRSDEQILGAPVSSIMTAAVHITEPGSTLEQVFAQMTEQRIRHLPVVDEGRLVGVVSIGDVVKNHISQVEFERDQLDSYVHQTERAAH